MASTVCLTITPAIRELAKECGLDAAIVTTDISIWQKRLKDGDNRKGDMEALPTKDELMKLRDDLASDKGFSVKLTKGVKGDAIDIVELRRMADDMGFASVEVKGGKIAVTQGYAEEGDARLFFALAVDLGYVKKESIGNGCWLLDDATRLSAYYEWQDDAKAKGRASDLSAMFKRISEAKRAVGVRVTTPALDRKAKMRKVWGGFRAGYENAKADITSQIRRGMKAMYDEFIAEQKKFSIDGVNERDELYKKLDVVRRDAKISEDNRRAETARLKDEVEQVNAEIARHEELAKTDYMTYKIRHLNLADTFGSTGLFGKYVRPAWREMASTIYSRDRKCFKLDDHSMDDAFVARVTKHFGSAIVDENNLLDAKRYVAFVYSTLRELFLDCMTTNLGESEGVTLIEDKDYGYSTGRGLVRQTDAETDTEHGIDAEDDLLGGEGGKVLERWQYDIDGVSGWDRMGPLVKRMFCDIQRDHMKTPFGTPVCYKPSSIVPELIKMLIHCRTSEEMLTTMEAKKKLHPWLADVVAKVQEDPQLRAQFFRKFSNAKHLFAVVNNDGSIAMCNQKHDNRRNELVTEALAACNGVVFDSKYSCYDASGRVDRKGCENVLQLLDDTFMRGEMLTVLYSSNDRRGKKYVSKALVPDEHTSTRYKDNGEPWSREDVLDAIPSGSEQRERCVKALKIGMASLGVNVPEKLIDEKIDRWKFIYDHIVRSAKFAKDHDKELMHNVLYDNSRSGRVMIYNAITGIAGVFEEFADSDVESGFNENGKYYYSFSLKSRLDEVTDLMSDNDDDDNPELGWSSAGKMREELHDDPFLYYWPDGKKYDDNGNPLPPLSYNTYLEAHNEDGREAHGLEPLKMTDDKGVDGEDVGHGLNYSVKVLSLKDYKGDATEYEKWDESDFVKIVKAMYGNMYRYDVNVKHDEDFPLAEYERDQRVKKRGALYPLFATSDVQSLFFFNGPKLTRRTLLDRTAMMARQELERMKRVDGATNVPACYYTRGKKFCFMDECNEMNGGPEHTLKKYIECSTEEERTALCEGLARHWLNAKLEKGRDMYVNAIGTSEEAMETKSRDELMVMNMAFAQAQAMQILLGDLAFYPDEDAVTKRCKEVIVPKDKVDWTNPQMEGKTAERVVYINDVHAMSTVFNETKQALDKFLKEGRITEAAYNDTISALKDLNTTDGQSYREFNSMMQIGLMRGLFKKGDKTYKALRRIAAGTASKYDFTIATASLPAVKSYTNGLMPVTQDDGTTLMMPFQYKLSEQLMTSAFMSGAATTGSSPALLAMQDYMKLNNIDVFMFTSCVKVGNNGAITLNGVDDGVGKYKGREEVRESDEYKSIMEQLKEQLADGSMVRTVPYSYYGTVSDVADESLDGTTLLGSQVSKLVEANMPDDPDAEFVVDGRKMKRDQVLDLYHRLIIELLNRKFKRIWNKMMDPDQVSVMLKRAAAASNKGGDSLSAMFDVDERGRFIIPLSDMSTLKMSSEFLNAMIRKELTKIKFKGGHFVQASSFGLNTTLHVTVNDDGTLTVPIYISAWHRQIIRKYMDRDGVIDVNKINEDDPGLLEMFGFRIPTEGKHFAMNMKVVGILPQISGNTIIMPADIIAYTDSDFDIDKIFMMIPEFEIVAFDRDRARKDYERETSAIDAIAKSFRNDKSGETMRGLANEHETFDEWFERNKERYLLPNDEYKLRKLRFDYDEYFKTKEMPDDDRVLRNAVIDVMRAMVSSKCVREQVLKSGGIKQARNVADEMKALTGDDLGKLPLCDGVSVVVRRASNNEGKNMIAVFAVANAMHAIAQKTSLSLGDGIVANLFGHSLSSLHSKYGTDGKTLINDTLGLVIGASSDNVNYPTLHYLGIGQRTSSVAELLLRLGCSLREVALFMNLDPIRKYSKYGDKLTGYRVKRAYSLDDVKARLNRFTLDADGMERLIRDSNGAERPERLDDNVAALDTFMALDAIASQLYDVDNLTRNDTGKGVPKGALENNIARMVRYVLTRRKLERTPLLKGWQDMFNVDVPSYDALPTVMDSPVKVAQAYTSFVTRGAFDVMSALYPGMKLKLTADWNGSDASTNFLKIVADTYEKFYSGYKFDDDAVMKIARNLFIYSQSSFACFRRPGMTAQESRDWYINTFPSVFRETVERYGANLAGLEFIKRLVPTEQRSKLNSRFFITFDFDGRVSKEKRDQFSADWEAMLGEGKYAQLSDVGKSPELRKLATDLLVYCFWRNGMQYGDKTFAHLAPMAVKEELPGYVDTLQAFADGIINNTFNFDQWIVQFLRNNIRQRQFCVYVENGMGSLKSRLRKGQSDEVLELSTSLINGNDRSKYLKYFKNRVMSPLTNKLTGDPIQAFCDDGEYYILRSWDPGVGVAKYVKTTPLGFGSEAREYDSTPGVDSMDMRTVYDQSKYVKHGTSFIEFGEKAKTKKKWSRLLADIRHDEAELADLKKKLAPAEKERDAAYDNVPDKFKVYPVIQGIKIYDGILPLFLREEVRTDASVIALFEKQRVVHILSERIKEIELSLEKMKEKAKRKRRMNRKALSKGARTKESALKALRGAISEAKYDRDDAAKDTSSLYIFIDSCSRSSGEEDVPGDSSYARKYSEGKQLKHPKSATTACLRGLDNAMPLTLLKRYYKGDTEGNRWTDADADEFKGVIHADVDAILDRFNNDDGITRMVWPLSRVQGEGIYGAGLAAINNERTPKLRKILEEELARLEEGMAYDDQDDDVDDPVNPYDASYDSGYAEGDGGDGGDGFVDDGIDPNSVDRSQITTPNPNNPFSMDDEVYNAYMAVVNGKKRSMNQDLMIRGTNYVYRYDKDAYDKASSIAWKKFPKQDQARERQIEVVRQIFMKLKYKADENTPMDDKGRKLC